MKDCEPTNRYSHSDTVIGIDSRELTVKNLAAINEYLSSPIKQEEFLKRQETILARPRHLLFDQSESELAESDAQTAVSEGWLVRRTSLSGDMFAPQALGAIVEGPPLNIDLSDKENRRSFSSTLVTHGIEEQKDILVVLNSLDQLDHRERDEFFDRLISADMKSMGGIRELIGAKKVQFIGIGDMSKMSDIAMLELFNSPFVLPPKYDDVTARDTLQSIQSAFKTLESKDSVWITSNHNAGKSTAFAALRQQFPEQLYIYKLDKMIKSPSDVYKQRWIQKEGQTVVFDRSEILDPQAVEFLEATFNTNKKVFSQSSEI